MSWSQPQPAHPSYAAHSGYWQQEQQADPYWQQTQQAGAYWQPDQQPQQYWEQPAEQAPPPPPPGAEWPEPAQPSDWPQSSQWAPQLQQQQPGAQPPWIRPAAPRPSPVTLPPPGPSHIQQSLPTKTSVPLPPPPATPKPTPVAYVKVGAKKPVVAQTASAASKPWPQSLKSYVERAFAIETPDRKGLQEELARIVKSATARDALFTTDWDSEPLPFQNTLQSSSAVTFSINRSSQLRPSLKDRLGRKRDRSESPPLDHYKSAKQLKMEKKKKDFEKKAGKMQQQTAKLSLQEKKALAATGGKMSFSRLPDYDPEKQYERSRRFGDGTAVGAVQWHKQQDTFLRQGKSYALFGDEVENNDALQEGPAIRGTCQTLEKSYFRLTSKPDPSTVRPEPVLRKALDYLVGRLHSGDKRCGYIYASDQFKGMRQDCTVQHLRSKLSCEIYEAHARCALENGDVGEYNQCQSQLQQHYEAGIKGCRHEFVAYRILYQAVNAGRGEHLALLVCLQSLSPEDALHPTVKHALKVRQALTLGDSAQVCQLYSSTVDMGQAILDVVMPKVRLLGLKVLLKAIGASNAPLPVDFLAVRLGFSSTSTLKSASVGAPSLPGCSSSSFLGHHSPEDDANAGEAACLDWLRRCGAVLSPLAGDFQHQGVKAKQSLETLHLPLVEKPAGPDLAIDDFLSKTLS